MKDSIRNTIDCMIANQIILTNQEITVHTKNRLGDTSGPKFGQHGPKWNQIWRLTKQADWLLFHSVENPSMGVSHLHFVRWGPGRIWAQPGLLQSYVIHQFYWPTSVCIGFNLCLPCFQRLPVSKRGSQYQQQLFSLISKYKLKGTTKIGKQIHARLKLERSL